MVRRLVVNHRPTGARPVVTVRLLTSAATSRRRLHLVLWRTAALGCSVPPTFVGAALAGGERSDPQGVSYLTMGGFQEPCRLLPKAVDAEAFWHISIQR